MRPSAASPSLTSTSLTTASLQRGARRTWRTVKDQHDAKAAVRFFRKDVATINRYGIDLEKIVLGGHSAKGAIPGIATYLDDPHPGRTCFSGPAGRGRWTGRCKREPSYDSSVAGWISLAGCLRVADLDWITPSSPPMHAVYGTKDQNIQTRQGHDHPAGRAHDVGRRDCPVRPGEGGRTQCVSDLRDPGLVITIRRSTQRTLS